MDINGKSYRLAEARITLPVSAPATLELIYNVESVIDGQIAYSNHVITFTGETALQKYLGLNIHNKTYELLCNDLGVEASLIPVGIESEIQATRVKSSTLMFLENLYCDFLKNEWTPKLRSIGFIAADAEITVQNTESSQNIGYLLALKAMDKAEYSYYAGEFGRLKSMIEAEGGTMATVERH